MNKYFVNYENALALKELGFNKPCFGYYNVEREFELFEYFDLERTNSTIQSDYGGNIKQFTAPLFHQAFEFILNKLKDRYDLIRYEIFFDESGSLVDGYHFDNFELTFSNLNEAVKVGINLIKENEKSEEY